MALRETFILLSNRGIEVEHTSPKEYPLFNYIRIHVSPDATRTNLSRLEAVYRYGQNEEEEISIALTELEALREQLQHSAPDLVSALARYTQDWTDSEAARLLRDLTMTSLEESGISRQQLILDAFVASLAIYVTFAELTRQPCFGQVTPLAYNFRGAQESNLLASSVQEQVRFQARLSAAMGRNEMGAHFAVATLSFVNIWSDLFRRRDEPTPLAEGIRAVESYLLNQLEKANAAAETFEHVTGEIHQMLDNLRRRISAADHAVLASALERISRDIDTQLKHKLSPIVATATANVTEAIKHSFRRSLAEVYKEYYQVLKDEIDRLVREAIESRQEILNSRLQEVRSYSEDVRKTREEIAAALEELRGLPRELQLLKAQTSKNTNHEERLLALERQIARVWVRLT